MSQQTNFFKLYPIDKSNPNRKRFPQIKIDVGQFIKRIKSVCSKQLPQSSQIKTLNTLFSLSQQNLQLETTKSIEFDDQMQEKQIIDVQKYKTKEIYAAIPYSKKCMICKEEFQCYFQHISSYIHKKNQKKVIMIGENKRISLNQSLQFLAKSINQFTIRETQSAYKKIRKAEITESQFSTDQIQMASTPRKLRITNNCTPVYLQSTQPVSLIKSANLVRKGSITIFDEKL